MMEKSVVPRGSGGDPPDPPGPPKNDPFFDPFLGPPYQRLIKFPPPGQRGALTLDSSTYAQIFGPKMIF